MEQEAELSGMRILVVEDELRTSARHGLGGFARGFGLHRGRSSLKRPCAASSEP
jgi:hypothetical protein